MLIAFEPKGALETARTNDLVVALKTESAQRAEDAFGSLIFKRQTVEHHALNRELYQFIIASTKLASNFACVSGEPWTSAMARS